MIIDFRMVPPPREYRGDPDQAREVFSKSYLRGYMNTYKGVEDHADTTLADLFRSMDQGGIDKAILQAEWAIGDYRSQNDAVYRIVKDHPERFIAGYLCINPLEDDDMASVVKNEVQQRDFKGVNIQGWAYRMRCNDRRFYPVYETCIELGIPVTIHSSINFTVNRTIEYSRPTYLDEVACDFPELIIVANHGGWPWVNELVAIAWKHSNVFIEIGAVSPKYIGTPGTGWDPLMVYGNSILQDRVLFATDSMLPHKRCVEELKALPLKDSVKEKWLGANAARILGLQ